jgi:adenine deaminase
MQDIIKGNLVDICEKSTYPAKITIEQGKISSIEQLSEICDSYILPGFVDAHVHIESSMIIPTEFSRLCLPHGTIATVSDPHEIANVLGMRGIEFMIDNAKSTLLEIVFGAPSCVPATSFETAGATIDVNDIRQLLSKPEIGYLSEMMNYPGVLFSDPIVIEKLRIAKSINKPIDGHAPGLRGKQALEYADAGITTDHECYSLEEAIEKIQYGMKILIREGSAAKNYNALHPLINLYPESCMFCSDDKHPDDLVRGHINEIVKQSIELGYDLYDVLRIAHLNPKEHYGINIGSLQIGDSADFIICNDLISFKPEAVYIKGICVAQSGICTLPLETNIDADYSICAIEPITVEALSIPAKSSTINVIECIPGELITKSFIAEMDIQTGFLHSDSSRDILKIVNINRYEQVSPALGFVKGMSLKRGAIASTIAHDSHNIIAVGVDDESMMHAINALIQCKGGIAYAYKDEVNVLPLDIAGLMSSENGYTVSKQYEKIDQLARNAGSDIHAPFMTLSFLALLVIPSLKLSDKGLFDGDAFAFTSLYLH